MIRDDTGTLNVSGAYRSTWLVEYKAQFYWCFISSGTISMDSGLVCPEINFKASRERTQPNRKQRNRSWLQCFFSVSPSTSLPPPLSTCLCTRAAAHFWGTVVCLCQMPKRLQNEEGHMKRGRVTVATVCKPTHTHTHTQKLSPLNLADSPLPMNPLHHPFPYKSSLLHQPIPL